MKVIRAIGTVLLCLSMVVFTDVLIGVQKRMFLDWAGYVTTRAALHGPYNQTMLNGSNTALKATEVFNAKVSN